ncbi:hypothetical protein PAECIP111893_02556 [Paenibacillus plantiphilus]|uniref:DUF4386 domain-containing protein n=1 Tax=Paenibacillus plantiphilus TaxID=2905650 RepID=A0ABN8GHQ1_9BACL|nr:DUF4386 domain-containing protein [Paenibacillus plantiphilus]CAH1206443.1 hypothetical protein PAECIP111893_02556 [Paenibacillus plantiphilus]
MTINKRTERTVAVLFLLATVAFMTGSGLIDSVLNQPDYLSHLYPNRMKVTIGLFLELLNSAAVVGIAILMLPILKQHNQPIAYGYLSSRIIESVLLIGGTICPILLVALSKQYISDGGAANSHFPIIGDLILVAQNNAFELAMIALSLGSLMFCYLLYRTRLIPRTLSLLGLVGYMALLFSSCLSIIGLDPGMLLFIPGGLFELIFPIWLIVKGFVPRSDGSN